MQPGTYEVKVSKDGFKPAVEAGVVVTANNTTRVDLAMQVGSVADSVPTNPSRALQSNVNGTPTAGVLVRIDGAASQQTWLPHIAAYVPALESIETVDVVTNSFSAEQGQAGGAAVNVQVRSGTNEIHGSAFEYHLSNKLLAKPFTFALLNHGNRRNPKFIFNQFGGTLSGPIVKNRLFYFAFYEGSPRREFVNNTATLPTQRRSGDRRRPQRSSVLPDLRPRNHHARRFTRPQRLRQPPDQARPPHEFRADDGHRLHLVEGAGPLLQLFERRRPGDPCAAVP